MSEILVTVGSKLVTEGMKAVVKRLIPLSNDAQIQAQFDKIKEEMVLETSEQLQKLSARFPNIEAEVERFIRSDEYVPLVKLAVDQVFHSATQERRKLFASVLAGLARPDVGAETKSRILRALSQVEATDVEFLRDYALDPDASRKDINARMPQGPGFDATRIVQVETLQRALLLMVPGNMIGGRQMEPTALGQQVLEFIQGWDPGR